jgi:hypothetical protein
MRSTGVATSTHVCPVAAGRRRDCMSTPIEIAHFLCNLKSAMTLYPPAHLLQPWPREPALLRELRNGLRPNTLEELRATHPNLVLVRAPNAKKRSVRESGTGSFKQFTCVHAEASGCSGWG